MAQPGAKRMNSGHERMNHGGKWLTALGYAIVCGALAESYAADADLESLERQYKALEAEEARARSQAAAATAKAKAEAPERAQAAAEAKARAQENAARQADVAARTQPSHFLADAGGGVLLQPSLNLEWTKSDNGSDIDWYDASSYRSSKRNRRRLPSTEELQSLTGGEVTPCGSLTCKDSPLFLLTELFFWGNELNGSWGPGASLSPVAAGTRPTAPTTTAGGRCVFGPPEHGAG